MIQLSVSFKTSSKMTSVKHNNRDLTEEELQQPQHRHIDPGKLQDNIYIKQENLKDCYRDLFGPALEEYNAKQKRSDRIIKDYYQHVKKSKTLDLQREFIVGIGNKSDWENIDLEGKKIVGQLLADYVQDFQRRHKHLYIYNAAVHLDEKGHPHAHFNVIPLATGYKKGLSIQPSFKRALQNEGYLDKGRSQLKAFKDGEVQVLEGMLQTLGIERKLVGTNDIKDMREYKQMIQEVNAEKERLISDIAVERSNLLSKQRELEGNIKHLYQVKNARESEIGGLDDKILAREEYAHKLETEVSSLEEVRLPRLRAEKTALERDISHLKNQTREIDQVAQKVQENALQRLDENFKQLAQEKVKQFPGIKDSDQDIAFIRELGYEGVDDLILQNRNMSGIIESYRRLWSQVKTVLQDLTLMNAGKKAREILELVTGHKEPQLDPGARERLVKTKVTVATKKNTFERRLEDVIGKARQAVQRQAKQSIREKSPSREDFDGPSL